MNRQIYLYGTWKSPITADLLASSSRRLGQLNRDAHALYWLESRPEEAGRQVIMRRNANGAIKTMTPPGFSVRNRVHEYGGGDYLIHDDTIYFSNDKDQRLYRQNNNEQPTAITPNPTQTMALRYADGVITRAGDYIICVREAHHSVTEVVNELVAIPCNGQREPKVIATGHDFYAAPRISPNGQQIAWICWSQSQMPWDGCELWVGDLDENARINNPRLVAGGEAEAIYQPAWSDKNELYFVSDRSGWWNIYKVNNKTITAVAPMAAECGYPQWIFGTSMYAFIDDKTIVAIVNSNGRQTLGLIRDEKFQAFDLPYDQLEPYLVVDGNTVFFLGASPTEAPAIIQYDVKKNKHEVVYKSANTPIEKKYVSQPQSIEFPTDNNKTAYAFYYPPYNENYAAPKGELPPLLVISHGGPTAATGTALNLKIQYWTSRGIAVVDVNYGGSTGYGREYRKRLNGEWGVVDVADCVNAAKYLIKQGKADPKRLIIRGGSAGGFTTLCALVFYDLFAVGASYYGVADLEGITADSEKFEMRYTDSLIGPYPEQKAIYKKRSPVNFADQISCPVIFFQGLEDKVVPPSQTEGMIEALTQKGLPYAYVAFENEQHGFRDANNIKKSLEAELQFYGKVLGFKPADVLADVIIHYPRT
ncbi:S9 family peptidase [Candidiatus Paracoxiella cheracis]|uniref:S9 family peptidase n=1 Tax=Candidiatus Paracoxiella cheracis TaxID=3405120 RepID=UPI003BF502AD